LITIRPIRKAHESFTDLQIFAKYVRFLRTRIYRRAREIAPGISDAEIRRRVLVDVFMYNWNNTGNTNARRQLPLADFNSELFLEIFEDSQANGSSPDLDIYDIVWKVWINPNTLQIGSSTKSMAETQGLFAMNEYPQNGCAAKALAVGVAKKTNKFGKKSLRNYKPFGDFLSLLETRLAFVDPKNVSIEELKKFVKLYPTYRLAVLTVQTLKPTIYEGNEYVRDEQRSKDLTIYLYLDMVKHHYVYVTSPENWVRGFKGDSYSWCHDCCTTFYRNSNQSCMCGKKSGKPQILKEKTCEHCNEIYKGQHTCGQSKCHYCTLMYKKGEVGTHRCPLMVAPSKTCRVFKGDENEYLTDEREKVMKREKDQEQYELWVWDIESHFIQTEDTTDQYYCNEDGTFDSENNELDVLKVVKLAQLGNYIYCKNVFTDQEFEFEDMASFINFTQTNNKGKNYFLAHNSSGYDSRLLFEEASKVMTEPPQPLMKGCRFMSLQLGNCTFLDTMFHLGDSLKNLGKAFQLPTEKGYFPHLFSTLENLDYVGPLPAKKYFDLTFTCKTKQDFDEFNEWHDSYQGDWNYREQRKLYCRNDVVMLAEIVLLYHQGMVDSLKDYPYLTVSPWFFPTMAGYVHALQIRHLHEGFNIAEMSNEELIEYSKTTWVALEPEEHYFAKKALRGGMTNICKYIADGVIHYQDIQSAYPSVQMDVDNLYPVGPPVIEVYQDSHTPCGFCYALDECTHSSTQRMLNHEKFRNRKINIAFPPYPIDLASFVNSFFGIITVDVTPPRNLYHPLIQDYDKEKMRVIGTLEPIKEITLPSVILKEAIKYGYIVTKIYRADRYKADESKFRNGLLGDMYVSKMKYAGKIPVEHHERMKKTFMDKYKIDLGDMDKYEKNAVRKKIAKGPVTAAWGKHAESLDHDKSIVLKSEGTHEFYDILLKNHFQLSNVRSVGDHALFNYKENRSSKRPDIHRGYLPVAVFVTAYGRLKLWRELVKIDPPGTLRKDLRVLMYDTDSIVYLHNPRNYLIPEGDCLGDWETEDLEKDHKGIIKFRAIAPKSYSVVCGDDFVYMKLKGAVLKYAHKNMISPDIMEKLVKSKAPGCEPEIVKLPQMSFDYKLGTTNYMTTNYYTKIIQFNEEDVKGTFDWGDYRGYPIGFRSE
jgi:hypothetical protein